MTGCDTVFEAEDDDENDNFENKAELSKTDEAVVDNMIDEMVDIANSQNVNLNAFADKPTESDPLGHLQKDISLLATKVNNLESSLSQQVADKTDDSVPRMVADALEERLPELLSDTLKTILPNLLKDSMKKAFPKFDKRVKNTLRAKVPEIILKPLNKEFNALNTMESQRELVRLIDPVPALSKAAPEGEKLSTQA
ncbi:hypothetical protein Tco_0869480 [Tanacetum coccineum]